MKKQLLKKISTYLILAGIFILLLLILTITILDKMGKGECINDTLAESILFFVCFPCIMAGLSGIIICAARKK